MYLGRLQPTRYRMHTCLFRITSCAGGANFRRNYGAVPAASRVSDCRGHTLGSVATSCATT